MYAILKHKNKEVEYIYIHTYIYIYISKDVSVIKLQKSNYNLFLKKGINIVIISNVTRLKGKKKRECL